ncbi:MAG: nitroreductase family protein [Candidatus Pacearchaeota archaeon]
MELDKAIKSRRSVRNFSKKKPDWRDIIECIDSMRYSPTAGGNCVLKVILVDNEELIKKISEACEQEFVSHAKYVVVVCSNPSRLINAYGDKNGEIYSRQQAGAAIENFLLKIEEKGLSTCWIGYFMEDKIKNCLKIPKEINVEAVFPIGFDAEKKKVRKEKIGLDNILYFNLYGEKRMKSPVAP